MRKRIFSRVLALFLVLSMLSTTAFAASFADFQKAIDGTGDGATNKTADGYYGYAQRKDNSYGITAKTKDDGSREVNLHEDVLFDKTVDKLNEQNDYSGINIDGSKEGQKNVTINMNGYTADMNPDIIVEWRLGGMDAYETRPLQAGYYEAIRDADGNKDYAKDENGEKIKVTEPAPNEGRILNVKNGAVVTVNGGEGGTLTGGLAERKTRYNNRGTVILYYFPGNGGAVNIDNSSMTMNNVNIENNHAAYAGGAVYMEGESSEFTMNGGSLANNGCDRMVGALHVNSGKNVALTNTAILNNLGGRRPASEYEDQDSPDPGGGIGLWDLNTATFDNCIIKGNKTNGSGGGLSLYNVGACHIKNTHIEDNKANGSGGEGGGIYSRESHIFLDGDNLIKGNSSSRGSGIYLAGSSSLSVATGEDGKCSGNEIYGNGDDIWLEEGTTVTGWAYLNEAPLTDEYGHSIHDWYRYWGWKEDKVATREYPEDEEGEPTTTESVLKWAHDKFYNVMLGDEDGNAVSALLNGAEKGIPVDLSKLTPTTVPTGYTFDGWVYSTNAIKVGDSGIDSEDGNNIILTPKWKINNYKADFTDPEGGNVIGPQNADYNTKFTKPADPERTGYTFAGWTLNGSDYDFDTPATDNITLTAKWNINHYQADFTDTEGGTTTPSQNADYNTKFTKPADPERTGYTFAGWTLNGSDYDFDTPATDNITLTAKWNINRYTATFTDPDGGNDSTTTEAEYNSPFSSPENNPTRDGYTFAGWTLNGEPFDFENSQATGDITLVAAWTLTDTGNDNGNDTGDDNGDSTTPDASIPLGDLPMTTAATTTIEDEEVPLAGIVTLADLLNALWEYEGIEEVELPEDFQWLDHDYAQAIYWGLEEGLVIDTEDDPLDPDELLTVSLMREVLVNFVELYHGLEDFEVVLEGADEDLVMDLGERLTVFYGELEAALEAQAA